MAPQPLFIFVQRKMEHPHEKPERLAGWKGHKAVKNCKHQCCTTTKPLEHAGDRYQVTLRAVITLTQSKGYRATVSQHAPVAYVIAIGQSWDQVNPV